MSDTICIYHGKCADGFTSAWAVYKALGEDIEFYPGVYGEAPPDVRDKDVIMVDFSYKRPVLEEMAASARSIIVLDHHKTAAEDLTGFKPPAKNWQKHLECMKVAVKLTKPVVLFDMERSGAGLTWDYFHPSKPRPNLVQYVEDRDLWKFTLPLSREVNAYIFAWDYSFKNWDFLAASLGDHMDVQRVAEYGAAIERKHHKDVAELVEVCKRRMVIGGREVWGASIPYTLTSDAGNLMARGEPFAVCYWDTPKGRVFSLRSTQEGEDVSAIAKQYGGGGHKNASGFTVPLSNIGQFELA